MSKFDEYQYMRREIEEARAWAVNGEGLGWTCRVIAEYVRNDRHQAPRGLDQAMADLMRREFPAFFARAIAAMERDAKLRLVAAKAEAEDIIAYKEADQ